MNIRSLLGLAPIENAAKGLNAIKTPGAEFGGGGRLAAAGESATPAVELTEADKAELKIAPRPRNIVAQHPHIQLSPETRSRILGRADFKVTKTEAESMGAILEKYLRAEQEKRDYAIGMAGKEYKRQESDLRKQAHSGESLAEVELLSKEEFEAAFLKKLKALKNAQKSHAAEMARLAIPVFKRAVVAVEKLAQEEEKSEKARAEQFALHYTPSFTVLVIRAFVDELLAKTNPPSFINSPREWVSPLIKL